MAGVAGGAAWLLVTSFEQALMDITASNNSNLVTNIFSSKPVHVFIAEGLPDDTAPRVQGTHRPAPP
jgi:hypothetical protein